MDLLDRVRRTIRRHGLARKDTRVVLAVSGGSDSVALTWMARALDAAGDLQVAGIAHFNHQLRSAADGDEQFCRGLADRVGWPILVGRGDVAAYAARYRQSIEHAARTLRYAFYAEARGHFAADVVALGHTRDDQAETFLLRLLRGAGARGFAAMYPRNGAIVRPLLECRRGDLRAYLAEGGCPFVEDETNADRAIIRNRVRADLLPFLESQFNPNIVEALAIEADIARDEWTWMEAESDELLARAATTSARNRVVLDPDVLVAAPLALRRLTVWRAMCGLIGSSGVGFEHAESALEVLAGRAGGFDAPGVRVERESSGLVLTGRPPGTKGRWHPQNPENPTNPENPANRENPANPANLFEYPLSIPGEVAVPEAGWIVSVEPAERAGGFDSSAILGRNGVAVVRGDVCGGALAVRNRRPGDRFRPAEVGRARKLQDFFVDKKVARERRDGIPIVVDATGRIVWVAGYAIDAAFRVTDPAQGVLILRLRQLGGPA